jgi:hypothetical protein
MTALRRAEPDSPPAFPTGAVAIWAARRTAQPFLRWQAYSYEQATFTAGKRARFSHLLRSFERNNRIFQDFFVACST